MKPIWDETWFTMCYLMAMRSDDPSTHSGCVIVDEKSNVLISTGYNGLPRGIKPTKSNMDRNQKKYVYMEHCERNAIYNAASQGRSVKGSTLYVNWYPCSDCARAIVQAGISTVYIHEEGQAFYDRSSHKKWSESQQDAMDILNGGGVTVVPMSIKLRPITVRLSNVEGTLEELNESSGSV